ncbi:hypothetical protein Emed_003655 [Eimeria media]
MSAEALASSSKKRRCEAKATCCPPVPQQKQQQAEEPSASSLDAGRRLWEGNKRKAGSADDFPRDTAAWNLLRSWLPPQLRKSQQKKPV